MEVDIGVCFNIINFLDGHFSRKNSDLSKKEIEKYIRHLNEVQRFLIESTDLICVIPCGCLKDFKHWFNDYTPNNGEIINEEYSAYEDTYFDFLPVKEFTPDASFLKNIKKTDSRFFVKVDNCYTFADLIILVMAQLKIIKNHIYFSPHDYLSEKKR